MFQGQVECWYPRIGVEIGEKRVRLTEWQVELGGHVFLAPHGNGGQYT
jgi:hypothetical protein